MGAVGSNDYELGTHLIICKMCHKTIKFNRSVKNWDGKYVCRGHQQQDPRRMDRPTHRPKGEGQLKNDIQKDDDIT